ncbi:TetR/AcrR family transcriptional regulator [Desulforhabdus sp. TSK]|uniref:TetR/AcrR family transcriptional regulator n=1 Tax=Desulforhabdus sp. TSK TaxID=2925014 RepID=UPI001FC80FDF|nr:TetR/AcrR family transcriptional regulator [Desulforhabdus sp. TSK]GKT08232.1 hypothetical protein DSTSK_15370 [Desulforhabdus sp. TSK]
MGQENNQHAVRAWLKKLSQKGGKRETLDRLVDSVIPEGAEEEVLEEIVRWLIALRDLSRQGALPPEFSLPAFISAFQRSAESRNVHPDRFYTGMLERVLLESNGAMQTAPKASTKDKILDAALHVFSEKGFHPATVDEIAERAGVGKGTLYRYFANKETLFNELMRLRLAELEESAMAVLDRHDDVLTMITKYLRIYFEFFDRNQQLYRLIVQERLDVGDQVHDLYFKKVMRRIPLLKRKIYGASQQGVLKDVDFHTVFYGVIGFMHGVIQKWLARDCSYSLVEELPSVVEVLFYGFVNTPKNGSSEHCLNREEMEHE